MIDASAALALAFADERTPAVAAMETRLMNGEPALTAANFHVEVLEGLLRGVRAGRIDEPDALAWLNVLDSYQITTAPIWPLGNGGRLVARPAGEYQRLRRRLSLSRQDSRFEACQRGRTAG